MFDFKARKEKKKADEAAKLAAWEAKERAEQQRFVITQEEFMKNNPKHFFLESAKKKHEKKLKALRKKWFNDEDSSDGGLRAIPEEGEEDDEGGELNPPDLVPSRRTSGKPTHVSAGDTRNSVRSEGRSSQRSGSAEGSDRDAYAAKGQSQRSSKREREPSKAKSFIKPPPQGFSGSVTPSNAEEQDKIRQDSKDSAKRREGSNRSQQSEQSRDTTQTQQTANYNLGNMARTHIEGMAPGNPTVFRPSSKVKTATVKAPKTTKKPAPTAANKIGDMKRTIVEGQVPKSQLPSHLKSTTVVSKQGKQGTYTSPKDEQDNLPHGWEETKDKEGRTFYQNSISRKTSWKKPSS
jgi:hypothetical protein